LIKNFFADKYGFTPKEVNDMDERDVKAFLLIENKRSKKAEREQERDKQKQKGRMRK